MKATVMKLAGLGFLMGMVVGALIVVIMGFGNGGTLVLPDRLLAATGSEAGALLAQMLVSGRFGMVRSAGAALYGEGNSDQIAEGVRQGMYEATARQNDLLREQNELLREIAMKDTTVEVTTNSFTKAINRKNQRDGKTVIPVST